MSDLAGYETEPEVSYRSAGLEGNWHRQSDISIFHPVARPALDTDAMDAAARRFFDGVDPPG